MSNSTSPSKTVANQPPKQSETKVVVNLNKFDASAETLEQLAKAYGPMERSALSHMKHAVRLAQGIKLVRDEVKNLLPLIKMLQGTPLGFKTDKPDYGEEVLIECCTEAILRGARWVGNEFNIIAGRCYITKEGYTRFVREIPGLTNLTPLPGIPVLANGGAVVLFRMKWLMDGVPQSHEREIPVRVNAGMGADAILGKAMRKMLAAVHFLLTGSDQSDVDTNTEVGEPELKQSIANAKTDDLKSRLESTMSKNGSASEPEIAEYGKIESKSTWDDLPHQGKTQKIVEREPGVDE